MTSNADLSKPLALFFQEIEFESAQVRKSLERLDLRIEVFHDPRKYLLDIRQSNPALLFIDLTTPKTDFGVAIIRTIRSILGQKMPILALVRKGETKMAEKAMQSGASQVVEKPILLKELAQVLARHVATDAISQLISPKAATAQAVAPPPAEAPLPQVPIPSIVDWHFERLMPVMAELAVSLETFEDIEAQLKHYAERLLPYRETVVKMVQTLRKSKEALDLVQSMRLYGSVNSRALIASLGLSTATKLGEFGFNARTNLPTHDPRKFVGYAIRMLEHFGEGSRYHQVAFNSGIVFDLLALLAAETGDRKRATLKFIESAFTAGLRRADRGFKLGKGLKDLALDRHIVSSSMMNEAGKAAMAIHHADYVELAAIFEKRGVSPGLQHVAENRTYGISHNFMGALLCQVTPGLDKAYKAVLFGHYPYLLKGAKSDLDAHALALLVKSL